jgi:SAM-dependent methyltransferase
LPACGSPIWICLVDRPGAGALAQAGYQATGVDVSAAMLELARRKVQQQGLGRRVTLVRQDMRELALDSRFALAFIAVNSFMHLPSTRDQLLALGCIRQHLRPGGLLLLDLFNPDLAQLLDAHGQVVLDKVMTDPQTGHRVMKFHSRRADLAEQTLHVTFIVDEMDGQGTVRRTLFPFSMRYLFRAELELLLHHAGFEIEAIYGSYELDEFSGDSDKMIAVARTPD